MAKLRQMMQSNDTKTMNLKKDIEKLMSKVQQTVWNGRRRQQGYGQKKKMTTTRNQD